MDGLRKAAAAVGGMAALARAIGIRRTALYQWREVPAHRVVEIEHLTGVPREELRPDLYRVPRPPKKSSPRGDRP